MAGGTGKSQKTGSEKLKEFLKGNLFIFLMVLAICIGVAVGMGVR